jgi:hypothetical protein
MNQIAGSGVRQRMMINFVVVCFILEKPSKHFDDEANPQRYLSIRVIKRRTADQVGSLKEIFAFSM